MTRRLPLLEQSPTADDNTVPTLPRRRTLNPTDERQFGSERIEDATDTAATDTPLVEVGIVVDNEVADREWSPEPLAQLAPRRRSPRARPASPLEPAASDADGEVPDHPDPPPPAATPAMNATPAAAVDASAPEGDDEPPPWRRWAMSVEAEPAPAGMVGDRP